MSEQIAPKTAPSERTVIGITFGNSNSSIAYTVDEKAEVIANEDGGKGYMASFSQTFNMSNPNGVLTYMDLRRPPDPHRSVVR